MGWTPKYFFAPPPPKPCAFVREQQLLAAFRKLDEREKATIIAMVSAAAKLGSQG